MRSLRLREDDIDDKPNTPPIAGPEIDDLDPADSGIDDGLLPPGRPDGRPGSRPGSRRGSRPPHTPTFPGNGVDYPGAPGQGPVCFIFLLIAVCSQETYTIVYSAYLGNMYKIICVL
jgi:hypothetical protein